MLVNIHHDTIREHRRLLVAGIGFLTAMAVLIGLSIAIYQKVFTPVTMVTVKAERAGLQLAKFGDVRMHGVLVGQVRSISNDGKQAVIEVGLRPAAAREIPDNVSVQILPTTLFGQKYLSFVDPARPSSTPLRQGSVIPASRVHTNVELQRILAHLFPLLRSIRPADLDATLYALSQALTGRGAQIGRTMSDLDLYLTTMNPHLPALGEDLALLSKVAHTYSLAAPDLIRVLRNATTTARTVAAKERQLHGFFDDLTGLADTSHRVLTTNGAGIIRESQLAVPLLRLLDTYSPEYPCLLEGADKYTDNLNQIFQNNEVNQTMSLDAIQRGPYTKNDMPAYGEIGHGPWCLGLPDHWPDPTPPMNLRDGYHDNADGRP
ncbi:MAG TPA: MCE family protein [Marmoricola sp.]|nr:MCE family protein [Marmoricola sp.]